MYSSPDYRLVQVLIGEEIERIVQDALEAKRILKVGQCASKLMRAYPNSGLSAGSMVNEIAATAACAGVPIEFGRSRGTPEGAESSLAALA